MPGKDVRRVLRQPDAARGNRQRRAERELPDEQKRHQAAQLARAVNLGQVTIRAAGAGHRRAQLGPDQPVADDQERAEDPAEHRLRPAHRRDDQRDRDERADADHVDHVQRRRARRGRRRESIAARRRQLCRSELVLLVCPYASQILYANFSCLSRTSSCPYLNLCARRLRHSASTTSAVAPPLMSIALSQIEAVRVGSKD